MVKVRSLKIGKKILPYLFVTPTVAILLAVFIYPLIFSLWVSLHNWSFLGKGSFVGLRNYIRLFTDPRVIGGFKATFILTGPALFLELVIGFFLAWLINEVPGKKRGIIRGIVIMPMFLNRVVVGLVWRTMYDLNFGIINYFLSLVGITPQPWAFLPSTAFLAIIICEVWQHTPFVIIVLSAGIEALPMEPFEAAEIDGATVWHKIRYIILPLLRPVILVVLIFRVVFLLAMFDKVYTLTQGAPGTSTRTLTFVIFYRTFYRWEIGSGVALSWVMLLIALGIGYLLVRSIRMEIY